MARKRTKKVAPKVAPETIATKKVAPKKSVIKKTTAIKKTEVTAAPAPKGPQGGNIWLKSCGGETTLHFSTTSAFEAATKLIESAPRIEASSGRGGAHGLSRVEGAHRAWSFRYVRDYKVTQA